MKLLQNNTCISLLILCLALSGCTNTLTQTKSGYLGDYSQLKKSEKYENSRIYQAPGFGALQLAQVDEIKLVPFEIWINQDKPGTGGIINTEQVTKLHSYFYQKLKVALEENYRIVDVVGENTLTIRGAFSGVKLTKPELSIADVVPVRLVMKTGNAAYLYATNQKDILSEVSIEAEFLLGTSVSRVFAMTSTKKLDLTVNDDGEGNFKAVTEVLDIWIDSFINTLTEIRENKFRQ